MHRYGRRPESTRSCLLAAALCAAASVTSAEDIALEDRGRLPDPLVELVDEHVAALDAVWNASDANQDGKLSVLEFARGLTLAVRIPMPYVLVSDADRNDDGAVDRDEACTMIEVLVGVRRADLAPLRKPDGRVANLLLFRHIDRNGSDTLEREEFEEYSQQGAQAGEIFDRGDADHEGVISFDEWWNVPKLATVDPASEFRALDANGDGLVDRVELETRVPDQQRRLARHMFPAFDLDRDGTLSLHEYRLTPLANPLLGFHEELADADDDGWLSFAEFAWEGSQFPFLRWEYFQRLDLNSDGALNAQEFFFHARQPDALFVMNADGTGWRRLFQLQGYKACSSPAVSPDGSTIAFDAYRVVNNRQQTPQTVFAVDADGTNPRELCLGEIPSWSTDGRHFACSRSGEPYGVWIMTAKGQPHKHICQASGGQWSPDGKRIAVCEGESMVMVYDLDSGEHQEVLGREGNPYRQIGDPSWSADSAQLCFKGLMPDSMEQIAIVDAAGAEFGFSVRHAQKGIQGDFAWHPHGDRIVCTMFCETRGRTQLYQFDPEGSDPPTLLPGQDPTRNNTDMCWTPDGTQLIVVSGDY